MAPLSFEDAVQGLLAGDFSRLDPLFDPPSPLLRWLDEGRFAGCPDALAEAFTCACFNGRTNAMERFLAHGVDPGGGMGTGLNAFHWAANRGQLAAVEMLLKHSAPLEVRNAYGGTVLGCAVWSALHEPRPDHATILQALLDAGAETEEAVADLRARGKACALRGGSYFDNPFYKSKAGDSSWCYMAWARGFSEHRTVDPNCPRCGGRDCLLLKAPFEGYDDAVIHCICNDPRRG